MKITNSNTSILRTMDKLGEDYDVKLKEAKEVITQQNKQIKEAEVKCKNLLQQNSKHLPHELKSAHQELHSLEVSAHPGFVTSFDNLDVSLKRRNMTVEQQNQDYHWVNHNMVENRISGVSMATSAPKKQLLDVENVRFLPSLEDQRSQKMNYIVLCSRVLISYFNVLEPLSDACIQHIPHKYSQEMSQKTNKVWKKKMKKENK